MDRQRLSRRRFLAFAGAAAVSVVGTSNLSGTRIATTASASSDAIERRTAVPGISRAGPTTPGQPLEIVASIPRVYQGGAVRLDVPHATHGTAQLLGRSYPLVSTTQEAAGYVGVDVGDPPGLTTVSVDVTASAGNTVRLERTLEILKTNWTVAHIWLPQELDNDDRAAEASDNGIDGIDENELLKSAYNGNSYRRWEEPWIVPIPGVPVSSYFGEQRSYNGGPISGHHTGTDLAAPVSTPILATNHGTVVLAQQLPIRGKMLVLDHGTGVYSGYAHLSEYEAVPGEVVERGQVIGRVGNTGLSTGPHLHWELTTSGIRVDGLRWLDGTQGF